MIRIVLSLLLFSVNVYSARLEFNKDHSQVDFKIKYLNAISMKGSFLDFSGSFLLKNDIPKEIEFNIKVESIFTGNKLRDSHLKRNDFFDIKKYPNIKFQSNKVKPVGEGEFEVFGKIQIKNISKSIMFFVEFIDVKTDTWNKKSWFYKFKSKIKRSDFDLSWNKTLDGNDLLLDEVVYIDGQLQAQLPGNKTSSSKHMIADNKLLRDREKFSRGELTENQLYSKPKDIVSKKEKDIKELSADLSNNVKNSKFELEYFISILVVGFFGFIGAGWLGYKAYKLITLKYENNFAMDMVGWVSAMFITMAMGSAYFLLFKS